MRLFVTIATWIRPRLAVFAIVCSVFAGLIKLTSAIYPLLLKDYIDALEDGVRDLEPVIAMALLFGITTLLEVVITVGYGRAHTSLERAIKLRVFKRATHLSSRNVKERGEGFFVNLIDEAVSACMQLFLPQTYPQLFALLKTVIIVIIVMQFDVVAALIMVVLLTLHCVQFLLNKRYFTPLLDTLYRLYREASAFITERIGLISLVEAFPSFRNTIVRDSERILDRVRRRTFRVELYSETLYRAVERYLQPPARFGLLLYLGLQYIAGVYDFGVLIMIITYYGSVEYGLTGLSHITEVYLRASVAVRTIDDFVGEPVKKHPPTLERKTFFFCVQDVEHSIDAKRILNRWSFRFPLGLTFGLVGATGRGKISLMSLLLGQEAPTAGAIYFLNTDNRAVETRIAASIVYLSQHAPILNGDLTDNITLGGADTTNRLQHVIEAVGISELRTRKFGVDGTALSGGERRKINVARFLFHIVEREYFIIDEAFLGMDGVTRKRLLHLVKTAIGTKTGIVISHNADVIDLLSDRVVYIPGDGTPRTGTHAELARDDPSYRAILSVDSIAGLGHV